MGVITFLFKKGDGLNPANWRPIIHHVVGRFIGENVALLRDLAHYCEVPNFPAAILSLYAFRRRRRFFTRMHVMREGRCQN